MAKKVYTQAQREYAQILSKAKARAKAHEKKYGTTKETQWILKQTVPKRPSKAKLEKISESARYDPYHQKIRQEQERIRQEKREIANLKRRITYQEKKGTITPGKAQALKQGAVTLNKEQREKISAELKETLKREKKRKKEPEFFDVVITSFDENFVRNFYATVENYWHGNGKRLESSLELIVDKIREQLKEKGNKTNPYTHMRNAIESVGGADKFNELAQINPSSATEEFTDLVYNFLNSTGMFEFDENDFEDVYQNLSESRQSLHEEYVRRAEEELERARKTGKK